MHEGIASWLEEWHKKKKKQEKKRKKNGVLLCLLDERIKVCCYIFISVKHQFTGGLKIIIIFLNFNARLPKHDVLFCLKDGCQLINIPRLLVHNFGTWGRNVQMTVLMMK